MSIRIKEFQIIVVIISTQSLTIVGNLVSVQKNVVAKIGETVHFNCSTDEVYSINWQHIPFGTNYVNDIYISRTVVWPYSQRFTVWSQGKDTNVTEFNLVITSVQRKDAGIYRCRDRAGMGEQNDAVLTVLDSPMNCNSNIDEYTFIGDNDCGVQPEVIRCSCNLSYFGDLAPEMKWGIISKQTISLPVAQTNVTEKSVTSVIFLTETNMALNGSSIVWYAQQSASVNWTSKEIQISYVKVNDSILQVSNNVSLKCLADSSETCEYRWNVILRPSLAMEKHNGPHLIIYRPGSYRCEADCSFLKRTCSVASLQVEYIPLEKGSEPEVWKRSTKAIVISVVITSSVLILIIVIITIVSSRYFIITKRRNRPKATESRPIHSESLLAAVLG